MQQIVDEAGRQEGISMESLDPRLQRLAFVQEWSDAFVEHFLNACARKGVSEDEVLVLAQKAAENLSLSRLREGGDAVLAQAAAESLGFGSLAEMDAFIESHPLLIQQWQAEPALSEGRGTVVAVSLTEVVFSNEAGKHLAFEKAKLQDVKVGDAVVIGKFGRVCREGDSIPSRASSPRM